MTCNIHHSATRWQRSLAVLLWLLAAGPTFAQLPLARLSTAFPPGGAAGTTVDVTLSGADLDEPAKLLFSHPGIGATVKSGNTFTVTIARDVPPGPYDVRVAGRFGASNPRTFVVSGLKEQTVPQANTSPATAMEVALDSIVNARATPNAVDHYRFIGKAGQRILIECDAKELDSRMEPAMAVYDSAGRELERNRRGGIVDFTPAIDAQYLLKVYDFTYKGGPEHFYRLSLSTGPHIDYVFPTAGIGGTKSRFTLFGRNLPGARPASHRAADGKPFEQLEVDIDIPPAPTAGNGLIDSFNYALRSDRGASNAIPIMLAANPVIAEVDPNDRPTEPQKISVPCDYSGAFFPRGDRDWITFDAKKGDVFWIELMCHRLGIPSDPFLLIQRVTKNDKGEASASDVGEVYDTDPNIAGAEYRLSTRDPAYRLEVKEDSTYRLLARDLFNVAQDNPALVYRLSIRKETPDFRLVVIPSAPPPVKKDSKEVSLWSPLLRRGGTIPLKVLAYRRDGFAGPVDLDVQGLPPGVKVSGNRIESGLNTASLMLTAADDATAWMGAIRITGKARIGEQEIQREANGATLTWSVNDPAEGMRSRITRDIVLSISGIESEPIRLQAGDEKPIEAAPGAKVKIPVKIARGGEWNTPLKLKPAGPPTLNAAKEIDVDAKAAEAAVEIDVAALKLPVGTHTFYVQSQSTGKYQRQPEAFKTAETDRAAAEKLATELTAELKKSQESKAAAAKAAADAATNAKKSTDALAEVTKSVEKAEAAVNGAIAKLAEAKTFAEKDPASDDFKKSLAAAESAVRDAAASAKQAADANSTARKNAEQAAAESKNAADASAAAQKAEADLTARLKETEAKKTAAAARLKELAPKDLAATFFSNAVTLRIVEPKPQTQPAKK